MTLRSTRSNSLPEVGILGLLILRGYRRKKDRRAIWRILQGYKKIPAALELSSLGIYAFIFRDALVLWEMKDMKRYLYPALLVCAALMMCRDAATLVFESPNSSDFRPAGEQQHVLQARTATELAR